MARASSPGLQLPSGSMFRMYITDAAVHLWIASQVPPKSLPTCRLHELRSNVRKQMPASQESVLGVRQKQGCWPLSLAAIYTASTLAVYSSRSAYSSPYMAVSVQAQHVVLSSTASMPSCWLSVLSSPRRRFTTPVPVMAPSEVLASEWTGQQSCW
jgi:hypothetical protein